MPREHLPGAGEKPRSMCPPLRADTSKPCVPENFSMSSRKSQVKRVPDTCGDTSGHTPPQRVPVCVSLKRHTGTLGRVWR